MLSNEDQNAILNVLRNRLKRDNVDPKSRKAKLMEVEFLAGAMTAINVLRPNPDPAKLSEDCPPYWVVCITSGRSALTKEG